MSADSTRSHRGLRRVGGGIVAGLLGLGAVLLLVLFLNSRDDASVDHTDPDGGPPPGEAFDGARDLLTADQLRLLAAGDVFLIYSTPRPPAALTALRDRLSGPPDPALEEAGQAVILVRGRTADSVTALASSRILRTSDPADPRLETFASHWLGRGSAGG